MARVPLLLAAQEGTQAVAVDVTSANSKTNLQKNARAGGKSENGYVGPPPFTLSADPPWPKK